jgi:SAM-dependent MidA family methyltransferase
MAERQRGLLADAPLRCRWQSFAELQASPRSGVMLAHEVLDALAVERVIWHNERWCLQGVALETGADGAAVLRLAAGPVLEEALRHELEALTPGPQRPDGWCTELHVGLRPWLEQAAQSLSSGQLLVIDYAHEAWRYYAAQRSRGTLMAYRNQQASDDPLLEPGQWDLTAHLCLETLERSALAAGWTPLGQRRQGEALLALGLAQRLHALQQGAPSELAELLSRREALLRFVDPAALGDFRWMAFARSPGSSQQPYFLQDPPLS